jgi:hypothetical protein
LPNETGERRRKVHPIWKLRETVIADSVRSGMSRNLLAFAVFVVSSASAMGAEPEYVVADWTFEEGTVGLALTQAIDQSGRGHNSVLIHGSPAFVAGSGSLGVVAIDCPPGNVFGSGFNVADAPDLIFTNEFTIEAVVLARYDNQGYRRVIAGRNGSGRSSYTLGYEPETDRFFFSVHRPGIESPTFATLGRDGLFHHVAGSYENGNMKLYRDGLLVASTNTTLTPDPGPMDAVTVGVVHNGGFWFNGQIDRVRISNRALNPGELLFQPIPVAWLEQYFGTNYLNRPEAYPYADPDADGSTNLDEYQAGTNPIDNTSGFRASVRTAPVISWPSVSGRTYRILRKDSLNATSWTTIVSSFVAAGARSSYVDVDAATPAFYVVELVP